MKTQAWTAFEALESRALLSTVTWDGGGGDLSWDNPQNWSGDVLPTGADDVVINAAGTPTITLDAAAGRAVHSLKSMDAIRISAGSLNVGALWTQNGPFTMTGGSVDGAGHVYLNGASEWSGGTIDGDGRLHVMPGNQLLIDGDVTLGRSLVNNGGVEWDSGTITAMAARIINMPGRTFDIASPGSLSDGGGGLSVLSNLGTLTRTGAGTTTIGILLNNQGELDVNGGTLSLAAGVAQRDSNGTLSGGTWVVNHATLEMAGGDIQVLAAPIGGTTDVRLVGADASFPALEHVSSIAFSFMGSTTLTLAGGRAFTFGQLQYVQNLVIDNPGVTVIANNLSITSLHVLRGTTRWTGGGAIGAATVDTGTELDIAGAAHVEDLAGPGLVRIQGATTMYYGDWEGGALIINAGGSLDLSGNLFFFGHLGTGLIPFPGDVKILARRIVNYGTITFETIAGDVKLGAELVNRGTIQLPATGFLSTADGTDPTGTSQTISNFGIINKDGDGDFTLRGAGGGVKLANFGTVHIRGGRLIANGGGMSSGAFVSDSATEMVWGGLGAILNGATLSGAGGVRVADAMQWISVIADMGQNLLVTAPGTLVASGPGMNWSVANLLNAGTLSVRDGTDIHLTTHGGWFAFTPIVRLGGMFENRGTLDLASGSALETSGLVMLDSTSTLRVHFDGLLQRSLLLSAGEFDAAGDLVAVYDNGFSPFPRIHLNFVTYATHLGSFVNVRAENLTPGLTVSAVLGPTTGSVVAS